MKESRPQSVRSSRSSSLMGSRGKSIQDLPAVVKENQLQWMFNRRKSQLIKTSEDNIKLYLRIQAQKSNLPSTTKQYKSKTKPTHMFWNKENH